MSRRIILASKSPRRHEIMKLAGIEFEPGWKDVGEGHPADTAPELIPKFLAKKKAYAYKDELEDNMVIVAADTAVLFQGKLFEKPLDRKHAIEMLTALSGRGHEVLTGVCILSKTKELNSTYTTKVQFELFTCEEIEYYVDNFMPYDKAGAYACQEWIGAIGIQRIEGEYYNIMGLPINSVYHELKKFF